MGTVYVDTTCFEILWDLSPKKIYLRKIRVDVCRDSFYLLWFEHNLLVKSLFLVWFISIEFTGAKTTSVKPLKVLIRMPRIINFLQIMLIKFLCCWQFFQLSWDQQRRTTSKPFQLRLH